MIGPSDFDNLPAHDSHTPRAVDRSYSLPSDLLLQPDAPLRIIRASSDPEAPLNRTLSRKLPPRLTESLERLALDSYTIAAPLHTRSHSRSSSLSQSPPTSPVLSHRRASRKLPPQLTESLEVLALQEPTSPPASPSKRSPKQFELRVDLPPHLEVPIEAPLPLIVSTPPSPPPKNPKRRGSKGEPKKIIKRGSASSGSSTITPPPVPPKPTMAAHVARKVISTSSFGSPSSRASTRLITPSSSLHNTRASDEYPNACSSGSASACGTWSNIDEYDVAFKRPKETRKEKKERRKAEKAAFDVDTPPTMRALYEASLMEVLDEHGERVNFGDLVRRGTTIVVFIRHWFCPLCAQYMNSIVSEVSPEALEEADVELIIIGNGSAKMLPSYKNKAMKCPFRMFTDPTLSLYRALGLTRQTGNAGPDSEAGDYLVQTSLQATMATIKRATQMPLLANPGHFTQLGGEFIFNGTLNVSYTHRMTTTRSHAPIRDICAEAGVRLEWIHYEPGMPPIVHRRSTLEEQELARLSEDFVREMDWREKQQREVERIRAYKDARRSGAVGGKAHHGLEGGGVGGSGERVDEVAEVGVAR